MDTPDTRIWTETDRPGESLTIGMPIEHALLMSVRGSTRCWTEAHTDVTLAAVARNQPGVAAHWRTRSRSLTTTAGGLMAINPGDVHVTRAVTAPAVFDVIKLAPHVVADAMVGLDRKGEFRFRSPATEDAVVSGALERVVRATAQGDDAFVLETACAEFVVSLITRLSETRPDSGIVLDPVRDFRLRRARDYLRAHLAERPTLDALASDLGLSKYRLCAVFKQAHGMSIGQYWTTWRILEASRRLTAGVPIKHVAADLGFTDEPFFNRVFRRHRGMPPASWLRLYRKNTRHAGL